MCKKIIYILTLFFISCSSDMEESKGNFNDIIILTSIEDRPFIEHTLNETIFIDTLFTPEPEVVYNKIWIKPNQFKFYKNHSNILIISVDDPIDPTIDVLIDEFSDSKKITSFPITLRDIYSKNQMITIINEDNKFTFSKSLDNNFYKIMENIKLHTDKLYNSRYLEYENDTLITDIIRSKFNIETNLRNDFKKIDYNESNESKFLWIGRGDIYNDNSLFQWIFFKSFDYDFIPSNLNIIKLLNDELKYINPNIELIDKYDRFKILSNETYNIYKINSLYNNNALLTGGPIVAYILDNKFSNKNLIFFGLVNAPGQSKLYHIKELESILLNSIF